MLLINKIRNFRFWKLIVIGYLLTVITAWSYGNSYTIYAAISIALMLFVYLKVLSFNNCTFPYIKGVLLFITILTLCIGFFKGNLKSPLMVNCSLLIPVAVASININYNKLQTQIIIAALCCLPIVVFATQQAAQWNSNCLAFLVYCGISIGFLWLKLKSSKFSKICALGYLIYAVTFMFMTGSRNAGMVIVLCALILILPVTLIKNKVIYRLIYLIPVFATIFALPFMEFIFSNDNISNSMTEFTQQYSQKAWGMDTHLDMLVFANTRFFNLDIFTQIFGEGTKGYHYHNLFYQCLFFYGFFGVFFIYAFFIWVFEVAYKLIVQYDDTLAIGCSIIMIGHFLMQIGEVYMLGAESANITSLIPAGIILQRYNKITLFHRHSVINRLNN